MKSLIPVKQGALSAAQFGKLTDVPPELEWLANITNEKTRRAYKLDAGEFSDFLGLRRPEEFRTVTRVHVIAWRETLAGQVQQAMEKKKISKVEMARRMRTSRAALDRLLDPGNASVTLQTMCRAAGAIGRDLRIELVKPAAG
ncbi:MAG: hypothetical protein D4R81_10020 [Nitrospiraceae bacterium]|nr:MAG: hypothetical protein D4R81_10020 [Nitrospiraceae bacterium]